jgi:hypothetical protein
LLEIIFRIAAFAGLSNTEAIVKNRNSFCKLSLNLNSTPNSNLRNSIIRGLKNILKSGLAGPADTAIFL